MTPRVMAVLEPVLRSLGAEPDPHAWVFWGDDPAMRYLVMVVTPPGLIAANIRVNVPQEGPRVAAKLVRWSRVQVGDLSIETAPGGHLIMSAQLEGNVFRATDSNVEIAAAFVLAVLAGIDGRPLPDLGSGHPARAPRPARPMARQTRAARATKGG